MIFKAIEKQKLLVILSEVDMDEMDITLVDLLFYSDKIVDVLSDILEKASDETGFDYPKSKIYIEIYPDERGDVAIYFTAVPSYKLGEDGYTSVCEPAVFEFCDLDEVINASVALFKQHCHRIFKSSVYKFGKDYRLIIYPLDCAEGVAVEFLKEFAPLIGCGEIEFARTDEYGSPIITDNAIDKLAYYLG